MNSVTVFSFRSEELEHSLKRTSRMSRRVSVEKDLASWALSGPSPKRASSSCRRSSPLRGPPPEAAAPPPPPPGGGIPLEEGEDVVGDDAAPPA